MRHEWPVAVAVVGAAQFMDNLLARFRALLAHRDFLLLELLVPQISLLFAARCLLGNSLGLVSSAYGVMLAVAPQWGWGVGGAVAGWSSFLALALSAAESRWELHARVTALTLHAVLFGMLSASLYTGEPQALAMGFAIPLTGACITAAYRVRRRIRAT